MDKLQEIISDLSLWHLASKEELKPLDINAGPCYIIEQSYVKDIMIGYMRKQQAIIEEHQRQQEVTVNQFRQAQEDIKLLQAENQELKSKVEEQKEESGMNDTYMVYDTQSEDVQFHGTMKSAGKDFECAMDGLDNGETAYILKVIKAFTPKGAAE
ncbi:MULTISPECIES: hypothetical protein [Bacillus amyloliquefaciens group]|uniref:hypothetical protein n=1 Tax=Bacillus amyloliquefaciens group TaxID=1938374 RepID=UPI0002059A95|nr:hypothetical protein [Bacillus amyloliquefaciens]AIW33178.1 hypothetical protein KS08_05815 [Bacillus subtilis]AEB24468.1 hypothetical protein BAMTA208_11515 [Bacillus amyloliquefaciens TA208]AEK89486.1 hypothetical protein BAXH7_02356 [Bacillus amyloliquefaciens XH7]MEC1831851.1 hypothetical protein [Bacillus amyloliquefaciens]MEC1835637.1 hypothetical protein [Bacillus amyloliquefaciens]